MNEELVKQADYKPERNEKGQLMPGSTANPSGRPKGTTLKEYQATKFRAMTDEDKEKYLEEIGAGEKWRMSEGNPAQTTEGKLVVTLPTPLLEVTRKEDDKD